jgi:predicted DNA binding protein
MAEALTEVVLELRLPESRLNALLARGRSGRIVLHPLAMNGASTPARFLVTTHGLDAEKNTVEAALAEILDRLEPVREEAGSATYLADLRPAVREAVTSRLAQALEGVGGELVNRPVLLTDGKAVISFVTTRAGPVEEGMRRLIHRLQIEGTVAHIVRIGRQHPAEQTLGLYEDRLTDKQVEILRLALALGLYDTPRRCTLEDLAHIFGISKAAAHSRMKNAERKILQHYFEV